jgi:hypothetical protein
MLILQRDKLDLWFIDGITMVLIEEIIYRILNYWVGIYMHILFLDVKRLVYNFVCIAKFVWIGTYI